MRTKQSGIYLIRNEQNGKVYIGQSTDVSARLSNHRLWLRSGRHTNEHLQASFSKYGIAGFSFTIVELLPHAELDTRERYWIEFYESCNSAKGYNHDTGGNFNKQHSAATLIKMSWAAMGRKNPPKSEETRRRLSLALKGRVFSEEHRRNLSIAGKGKSKKPVTAATRLKLSLAGLGKHREPKSPEVRRKIAEALKGRPGHPQTAEARRKIGNGHRGKIVSAETLERMRIAHRGKPVSAETRARLSAAQRGFFHNYPKVRKGATATVCAELEW